MGSLFLLAVLQMMHSPITLGKRRKTVIYHASTELVVDKKSFWRRAIDIHPVCRQCCPTQRLDTNHHATPLSAGKAFDVGNVWFAIESVVFHANQNNIARIDSPYVETILMTGHLSLCGRQRQYDMTCLYVCTAVWAWRHEMCCLNGSSAL